MTRVGLLVLVLTLCSACYGEEYKAGLKVQIEKCEARGGFANVDLDVTNGTPLTFKSCSLPCERVPGEKP